MGCYRIRAIFDPSPPVALLTPSSSYPQLASASHLCTFVFAPGPARSTRASDKPELVQCSSDPLFPPFGSPSVHSANPSQLQSSRVLYQSTRNTSHAPPSPRTVPASHPLGISPLSGFVLALLDPSASASAQPRLSIQLSEHLPRPSTPSRQRAALCLPPSPPPVPLSCSSLTSRTYRSHVSRSSESHML
ncbi:hypothetical protein PYCCODRAFT_1216481 [Trametes coccinea BRFM310]|uniref:Uncharacterized protein n=1 Tax=Trametes coccinea (strain BRFM310) TaxID=1353009 RepID=A0A1Y2I859_TRAC3|nr:hypothetical protein PYCCODRAFT_1216481 [Trametes coccinea BRFM310]